MLQSLQQDVRYALRTIAKTPMFTAAAIVSLALGIGGNTAIFSLIDALLIKELPVDRPDQLYFLARDPGPDVTTSSNYPVFERYRTIPSFSGVTAYRGRAFRVTTPDGLQQTRGQFVSGNYHAVVGVPFVLGRGFSSEPDRGPASLIAVISDDYWTSRFARRPDVLGQSLVVADRALTIVGVTAPGFRGLNPGGRIDISVPMSVMALDTPEFLDDHAGWVSLVIVGRLAPGVSAGEALAATDLRFQQFMQEPDNRWARGGKAFGDAFRAATLVPAARGSWGLRRQYSRPLWISMGLVGAVLLIGCANIANLLLARATARSREVAVRLSLGATRGRLVRQLLTESLLLASCGGAAGLLVAVWGTDAILSVLAFGPAGVSIDAALNPRVCGFTAAVVLLTGLGFGLVPAFRSTRLDLAPTLKNTAVAHRAGGRTALGRSALAAQVALCVLMVSVAMLLSRSLSRLERFDAGFDREHILLADVNAAGLDGAGKARLFPDALDRLHRVPGVRAASLSSRTPIDFSSMSGRIEIPGSPPLGPPGVSTNLVTPEYFQAFGIALLRGRGFTEADRHGAPRVAVVSDTMARRYYKDLDPIGRTFILGAEKEPRTIVGVVEDVRHEFLRADTTPSMVYVALAQHALLLDGSAGPDQLTIALRTAGDPAALAATIRGELRALSPRVLVPYVRTMTEQVAATLVPEHLLAALSTALAVIAVLLACVGLYGVMSYNVARRTREIGIRIALGAVPRTVLSRVLRETVTIAIAGVAAGITIALAATPLLSTFLFQLTPHDPATLIGTAALLLAVAAAAGFFPARHAASVDPVQALRSE